MSNSPLKKSTAASKSRSRSRSADKKCIRSQESPQSQTNRSQSPKRKQTIAATVRKPASDLPNCIDYLKGICKKDPCLTGFHPPIQPNRIEASEFDCSRSTINTWSEDELDLYNLALENSSIEHLIEPSDELILIRHSLSEFNFATFRLFHQSGITYMDPKSDVYQLNAIYIDTALHPIGEIMCENNAKFIQPIKFHTVFVSPLKRTLQTTALLFKHHPQKDSIKFVLLPLCSESLSKVCDISDLPTIKHEFADGTFNTDIFEAIPSDWQIDTLIEDESIRNRIKVQERETKDLSRAVLDEIRVNHFPKSMEAPAHVASRVVKAKELIRNYIAEHQIDTQTYKIGLVSHFGFLNNFTAQPNSNPPQPGRQFSNCEAFPFHL